MGKIPLRIQKFDLGEQMRLFLQIIKNFHLENEDVRHIRLDIDVSQNKVSLLYLVGEDLKYGFEGLSKSSDADSSDSSESK